MFTELPEAAEINYSTGSILFSFSPAKRFSKIAKFGNQLLATGKAFQNLKSAILWKNAAIDYH